MNQNKEKNILSAINSSQKKINHSLLRKFVFGVIIIIVPILGLLFTWIGIRMSSQGKQETIEKARIIADQIILTRQWVTDCMGGVFVNVNSSGADDVNFVFKKQISTPLDTYQFFTPSMVTQKLSQYSFETKAYQFRLSSLSPINAENYPNAFEKEALRSFAMGSKSEYYKFTDQTFDYMTPLYHSKGCLKCHANDGILKTGIIGGLRVTIPYWDQRSALQKNIWFLSIAGLLITLSTIIVLVSLIQTLIVKPINKLEEKSCQISSGDLTARVSLHTNDELEKLGSSFNVMAESLMQNRDSLEEKVAKATKDLALANQDLLKLDKLKSNFLANMSHELRTPLTAVRGSIDYLERKLTNQEDKEFVKIIEKNILRLTRLISNLFDFTKLEAGTIDWEFEKQDIPQLVREVIDIMTPQALGKKNTIILDCPEYLEAVIDLDRMEQALVNLLDNAIKFSKIGGKINIQVKTEDNNVQISIEDKGMGIPGENLETVFEKFYTTNEPGIKNQGAGMGLAISKAIIKAHKGRISVESDPGISTTFYITLPKRE